jgi:rhodanese-related sulfurtransferase
MQAIVATNQGQASQSWAMLRHPLPHIQDVSIEEAAPKIERGDWWVLDIREDEEWQRVRIPGAHHIPQSQLASRMSEIPASAVPLVVCQSGIRSHRGAQFLKQADFPVVYSLTGGTGGWHAAGLPVESDGADAAVILNDVVGHH